MAWSPPASDAVSIAWTPPEGDAVEGRKFTYQPPFEPAGFLAKDPRYSYGSILPVRTENNPIDRRTASESGGVVPFVAEHLALPDFIREPLQGAVQWGEDLMGKGQAIGSGATPNELTTLASLAGAKPFGMSSVARGTGMKIAAAGPAAATKAAETAQAAGYVLPPSSASPKPGTIASLMEGLGGEAKTAQSASAKNQTVTNNIAAHELGLPKGTMLTDDAFESVRGKAANAYKAVEDSGVPIKQDMQFVDDLLKTGQQSEEMAKDFPGLAKNEAVKSLQDELGTGKTISAKSGIQAVRRLRYKASKNLKSFDDPDKVELGMAQRHAAEAIDNLIERNLADAGKPELVNEYRAARQMIAKSHDVESATNTATGNVNAHVLARLSDRGRPFTGGLKLIADTGKTFPRATQNPEKFGGEKKFSAVDALFGLLATHGNPKLLAGILARPAAREIALSKLMRNAPVPYRQPSALAAALRPVTLNSILRPVQQPSEPMVPSFARP